ncbi:hypothetical protein L6452_42595 [Arctium lappa]|uniref:Uncharacterized protein n=1 Tax=Arctium lappa TaxID=4217 RepID=A0ACB8XKG1_ARCLA|nr:hypothetical protein L6452_42595 [Arctium lappa]
MGDEAATTPASTEEESVVFIGSALLALQQLSGINVVFYFYSNIFKSSGVPSDIANMSVGVVNLSGLIVAMVLMGKLEVKGSSLTKGIFDGHASSCWKYLSIRVVSGVPLYRWRAAVSNSRHQVINFFVGLLYLRLLEQLGAQILYSLRKLLLVGIFLCQEQCGGNKRKNFARD